ncbi:MAG: hypothetical protein ABI469_02305 [Gemmatimonadales bacterium]
MFIELLDLLRCTNRHEDTWLVASFSDVSNRFVLEASLGCPSCSAQYKISRGIADFSGDTAPTPRAISRPASSREREQLVTRAGAFLNATEPGATVILGGSWAEAAQELSVMAELRVLALNAAPAVEESETVGLILVGSEIPVAPGSVLGVALDDTFPPAVVASAVKAVRAGGRIVGPTSIEPPKELAVLARDADYWVAEKAPAVIKLSRAGR